MSFSIPLTIWHLHRHSFPAAQQCMRLCGCSLYLWLKHAFFSATPALIFPSLSLFFSVFFFFFLMSWCLRLPWVAKIRWWDYHDNVREWRGGLFLRPHSPWRRTWWHWWIIKRRRTSTCDTHPPFPPNPSCLTCLESGFIGYSIVILLRTFLVLSSFTLMLTHYHTLRGWTLC